MLVHGDLGVEECYKVGVIERYIYSNSVLTRHFSSYHCFAIPCLRLQSVCFWKICSACTTCNQRNLEGPPSFSFLALPYITETAIFMETCLKFNDELTFRWRIWFELRLRVGGVVPVQSGLVCETQRNQNRLFMQLRVSLRNFALYRTVEYRQIIPFTTRPETEQRARLFYLSARQIQQRAPVVMCAFAEEANSSKRIMHWLVPFIIHLDTVRIA